MVIWDFLNEWGGHLGALVGVLLPNFGAYYRSKNACGPKERAYLWKVNVLTVPIVTVGLLGLSASLKLVVPPQYKHWPVLAAVLILLPYLWISTVMCNRRLVKIRAEEPQPQRDSKES